MPILRCHPFNVDHLTLTGQSIEWRVDHPTPATTTTWCTWELAPYLMATLHPHRYSSLTNTSSAPNRPRCRAFQVHFQNGGITFRELGLPMATYVQGVANPLWRIPESLHQPQLYRTLSLVQPDRRRSDLGELVRQIVCMPSVLDVPP